MMNKQVVAIIVAALYNAISFVQSQRVQQQQQQQQQEDQIKIFHVPMPPNWPVIMAPDVNASLTLQNPTFTWEFPNAEGGLCTSDGRTNLNPCVGRVVDYSFTRVGEFDVRLTVTDANLRQPMVITKKVRVFEESEFPTSIRPEMRQCDDAWFARWRDALYRLKELGIYDHLSRLHLRSFSANTVSGSNRTAAHSGPSFLIWHRMTMRVVERAIATASGDDTMGLPFWDWMKGWDGLEKYFGPTGNPNNNFIIESGPWCQDPNQNPSQQCSKRWSLPPDYPDSIKALTRNIGEDAGFRFQTQQEFDRLMSVPVYDAAPFDNSGIEGSFRNVLEGWVSSVTGYYGQNHNGIHRFLGGTMRQVEVSFNDPIFLIHHSQVDRLLTFWQDRHGCSNGTGSATCYRPGVTDPTVNENTPGAQQVTVNGQRRWVLVGHMYDSVLYPWNLRVQDLLPARKGYDFLDTNAKPPAYKLNRIDDTAEPLLLSNGARINPNTTNNVYPVQGAPKKKASGAMTSYNVQLEVMCIGVVSTLFLL
ncbi:hypothetical protein MP228_004836 [Amoeboaphelidium protococcarum]|nr:hypothetical protein MP228_004836 [Amoeboaphelidium protococcarum]